MPMSTQTLVELVQERPDIAWEVAPLLPMQGEWSEEEYLWLTNRTRRLVEFSDGHIEVLSVPTDIHQAILGYLFRQLSAWLEQIGGVVRVAGLRVRIAAGLFREPDLIVLCDAADPRRQNDYWHGADLVVEIVSPDDPKRDLVKKRREYARAHIPEYWIVYPKKGTITVLRLDNGKYVEHGIFGRGDSALSALLEGFAIDVNAALDAN
jgi:Uma2 family endonuclease